MKAGFSEIVITPQESVMLAGYGRGIWSTGVHDDLYASAVYLEDGDKKAVLISFDLIGFDAAAIEQLKSGIQEVLPLDADHIFFTCTHTHEGPIFSSYVWRDEEQPDYFPRYRAFLTEQVKKVVKEAASAPREFDLGVNRSFIDENMNRRFFLNNGTHLYIPNHKELEPISFNHEDKELGMLYFFPKGDRHPFGVIVNWTMHPLTAGNTSHLISSDVAGVVREVVRESLECPTCYISGAAGDNHPKRPEGGFTETRRVGWKLGTEVVTRRYDSYTIPEPVHLKCLTRSVMLKSVTEGELKSIPGREEYARRRRRRALPKELEVGYTLLALGPVLLIGVPGEWFAELGSILKWMSPFQRTYIMFLATASYGYIAHLNAYSWGGYETANPRISPRAVRRLVNAILDSAEELYDASV